MFKSKTLLAWFYGDDHAWFEVHTAGHLVRVVHVHPQVVTDVVGAEGARILETRYSKQILRIS